MFLSLRLAVSNLIITLSQTFWYAGFFVWFNVRRNKPFDDRKDNGDNFLCL